MQFDIDSWLDPLIGPSIDPSWIPPGEPLIGPWINASWMEDWDDRKHELSFHRGCQIEHRWIINHNYHWLGGWKSDWEHPPKHWICDPPDKWYYTCNTLECDRVWHYWEVQMDKVLFLWGLMFLAITHVSYVLVSRGLVSDFNEWRAVGQIGVIVNRECQCCICKKRRRQQQRLLLQWKPNIKRYLDSWTEEYLKSWLPGIDLD